MTSHVMESQSNRFGVVYVPSRRAPPSTIAPYKVQMPLVQPNGHREVGQSNSIRLRPPFLSSGAGSAFTAVHPRCAPNVAHQNPVAWPPHPPLALPKLASIQQSYTKLFARNELLKLLVSKQLRQLYAQHQQQQQQFDRKGPNVNANMSIMPQQQKQPPPPAAAATSNSCRKVAVTVRPMPPSSSAQTATSTPTPVPNKQFASQRLLELSTVIKAINAKPASTAPSSSVISPSWATMFEHNAPQSQSSDPMCAMLAGTGTGKVTHLSHHDHGQQRCQQGMDEMTAMLSMAASATSKTSADSHEMVFKCEWNDCNRTFATPEQWSVHVTHTHVIADADDGLYYCQWRNCPRAPNGFNARYKMLIHVRSHTNDKPYRCSHCSKAFLRSETLRIHKRIHSSEKLFGCKFLGCTKRYTDPSSLRKHVKTKNHIVIEV